MKTLCAYLLIIISTICQAKRLDNKREAFETLIFEDNFDEFDLSVWRHDLTAGGGGNWEFEFYTNNRSNSYVRDGVLYIKPTLTVDALGNPSLLSSGYSLNLWGNSPADQCTGNAFYGCERYAGAGGNILPPIQSAALRTVNSFSFKYGKLEVRAKLPKGDWLWPAIWLLPTLNSYGNWPASGEIDLMESRGNAGSYRPGGVSHFGSTLHWGPFFPHDPYEKTHASYTLEEGDFSDDFHIFGLLWSETSISTYLDDPSNVVLNVPINQSFWQKGGWDNSNYDNPWQGRPNSAPFDQKFYLILNVAVGGSGGFFPDGYGKPWSNTDSHAVNSFWQARNQWYPTWQGENAAMQIDYVRVYQ